MTKIVLKYSYYIVSMLFFIGLILIVFVREQTNNEFYKMIINYYFWYSFGLFSGFFLARVIIEKYTEMVNKEKLKE